MRTAKRKKERKETCIEELDAGVDSDETSLDELRRVA